MNPEISLFEQELPKDNSEIEQDAHITSWYLFCYLKEKN